MKTISTKKTSRHTRTAEAYIIKLGNSQAEVITPPGLPSPDPDQPLAMWIGKQVRSTTDPQKLFHPSGHMRSAYG